MTPAKWREDKIGIAKLSIAPLNSLAFLFLFLFFYHFDLFFRVEKEHAVLWVVFSKSCRKHETETTIS